MLVVLCQLSPIPFSQCFLWHKLKRREELSVSSARVEPQLLGENSCIAIIHIFQGQTMHFRLREISDFFWPHFTINFITKQNSEYQHLLLG